MGTRSGGIIALDEFGEGKVPERLPMGSIMLDAVGDGIGPDRLPRCNMMLDEVGDGFGSDRLPMGRLTLVIMDVVPEPVARKLQSVGPSITKFRCPSALISMAA